jgi:hypothetical protein
MPAATTMTQWEKDAFTGLDNRYRDVDLQAWAVYHYEKAVEHFRQVLIALLQRHPDFEQLTTAHAVVYNCIPLALVAACVVDALILGTVGEFLASSLELPSWLYPVVQVMLPVMLILIEVKATLMLGHIRQRIEDRVEGHGRYYWYLVVACLAAIAIPAGSIAIFYAVENDLPSISRNGLLLFQIAFSLAMHLAILTLQRDLALALGYQPYRVRRWYYNKRIRTGERGAGRHLQATAATFRNFAAALDRWNHEAQGRLYVPPPFDTTVREILRRLFGPDVIRDSAPVHPPQPQVQARPTDPQSPAGPVAPAPAPLADPQPPPAPLTPQDPVEGENEYLRDILRRRVNDADREVRA